MIVRKIFKGNFRSCLLGKLTVQELIKEFENDEDYEDIKKILDPNNQEIMCPLLKDNINYIYTLKDKGYHLYILSNLIKETHDYLARVVDIENYFDGAVFSHEVGLRKPDKEMYECILNKYNLNKDETIFFDDKERNVISANEMGIKSYVFNSLDDLKRVVE